MKQQPFKVVDVFAGAGGLGEGFAACGWHTGYHPFKIAVSIEKEAAPHATLTLRAFYRQFPDGNAPAEYWAYVRGEISKEQLFEAYPRQRDAAYAEALCLELGKKPDSEVHNLIAERLGGCKKWVLVGGPPCQAYSLVGRARMRSTRPDFG